MHFLITHDLRGAAVCILQDAASFPLFDAAWGGDEELLLLEAIEMYGFGNWGDIADHVGTKV